MGQLLPQELQCLKQGLPKDLRMGWAGRDIKDHLGREYWDSWGLGSRHLGIHAWNILGAHDINPQLDLMQVESPSPPFTLSSFLLPEQSWWHLWLDRQQGLIHLN